MGFDAMSNGTASAPAMVREIGKKKRANRTAKLKQCKLDARREQWLSQVKSKGCKDESLSTSPTSPQQFSEVRTREKQQRCQAAAAAVEHDQSSFLDSSDTESPTHQSAVGNPSRKECPTSFSSSSGSSVGSCSRNGSDLDEEEAEGKGGGGLDDWEAVADALYMPSDNQRDLHPKSSDLLSGTAVHSTTPQPRKQQPNRNTTRAWRPDDEFRPPSLPNLSKQWSFPVNMGRHYAAHHNYHAICSPPPLSCPICYEDLDLTDSSFLPCSCGFRLCLFCHKRILEDDGRCPGCRKQYTPVVDNEDISIITRAGVPPLSYQLSRSCSMSSR